MSHPDKTIKTINKRSRTIRNEKCKSSCIHALLLSPGPKKYHSSQDFIPSFLEYKSECKTSSKKTPKRRKQKKATKEIRNDIADGHEMYADTKCTAHGLAMMSFIFRPCCGGVKLPFLFRFLRNETVLFFQFRGELFT